MYFLKSIFECRGLQFDTREDKFNFLKKNNLCEWWGVKLDTSDDKEEAATAFKIQFSRGHPPDARRLIIKLHLKLN